MDIEKLKKRCGYDGKPQQFKYGFDLACRELVNTVEQAAKAQAVPEGFLLMPRKCTNKMAHAAKAVDGRLSAFKYADVYDAMVEAQELAND